MTFTLRHSTLHNYRSKFILILEKNLFTIYLDFENKKNSNNYSTLIMILCKI